METTSELVHGSAPRATPIRQVRIYDALPRMRPADLLLWRDDQDIQDLMIARAGRSAHSHAAMLDYARQLSGFSRWRILEVTQWHGGRDTSLRDSVRQYPGHWDLFRANADNRWPEWDGDAAVRRMRRFVDCEYGWLKIWSVALLRMPVMGTIFPADLDDSSRDDKPPICSEAVSIADCAGGVDPVPNLANRYTEPGDLARSLFYRYELTLVP